MDTQTQIVTNNLVHQIRALIGSLPDRPVTREDLQNLLVPVEKWQIRAGRRGFAVVRKLTR